MMKLINKLFCVGLILSAFSYAGNGVVVDSRDGKSYHEVKVGDDTWLAENLKFKSKNSYCYDDASSCDADGRLYTWEIAMSVCPEGWRLPTDKEWSALLNAQGGWQGLKRIGFQVPMAGDRRADGVYHYQGESAFFWSGTPSGKKYFRYKFDAGKAKYDRTAMVEGPAYSVKCVAGSKPCSSPLMNAVRAGNINKVKYLLDAGAPVNEDCGTDNPREMIHSSEYELYTYLGLAIEKNNLEMVRLLLSRGANPNEGLVIYDPNDLGITPLMLAMENRNMTIFKTLLDNGASIGFCDMALGSGYKDEFLKILAERIDVKQMNNCWGGTSLVETYQSRPSILNILRRRGAKSCGELCEGIPEEERMSCSWSASCGP